MLRGLLVSVCSGALALGGAAASAAIVFDDFSSNTLSDYNVSGAGQTLTYSSTTGVGTDLGRLDVPVGGDRPAMTYSTSVGTFNDTLSYEVSGKFLYLNPGGTAGVTTNVTFMGLGLSTLNNGVLDGGTDRSFVGVVVRHTHTNGVSNGMFLRSKIGAGDSNTIPLAGTPWAESLMVSGNWYEMVVTFTLDTPGSVLVSADLYDRGSDGTAARSLIGTLAPHSVSHADFTAETDLFAGFTARRAGATRLGSEAFDNFTVIPEPASLGLLGVAGLLMLRRRRC